jgi:hypothetical protein
MITIFRNGYVLLLSYSPCEVFTYFNVKEMHGLSYIECDAYANTNDNPRYVFINLSRCGTDIETFGLIMHELMHQSFHMHKDEEDIITWAELESYEVFKLVKENL